MPSGKQSVGAQRATDRKTNARKRIGRVTRKPGSRASSWRMRSR